MNIFCATNLILPLNIWASRICHVHRCSLYITDDSKIQTLGSDCTCLFFFVITLMSIIWTPTTKILTKCYTMLNVKPRHMVNFVENIFFSIIMMMQPLGWHKHPSKFTMRPTIISSWLNPDLICHVWHSVFAPRLMGTVYY